MSNTPTMSRTGVCKDEKASRDECFLLTEHAETKCLDKVAAYKACMAGFGFNV
ncbi:hypothetical protein HOY80DRAFT_1036006 [Tuber brumale]|nr:hypothetical protein HOY80DRAFT_1036006 [Tuber brumale]